MSLLVNSGMLICVALLLPKCESFNYNPSTFDSAFVRNPLLSRDMSALWAEMAKKLNYNHISDLTSYTRCYNGDLAKYSGTLSRTQKGFTCQRWDTNYPHKVHPALHPGRFPDNSFSHNYCRYTASKGQPWCYTTDPGQEWDLCDVTCTPCPANWYVNPHNGQCVRYFQEKLSYAESIKKCGDHGAVLPAVNSELENIFLHNFARLEDQTDVSTRSQWDGIWLGGDDIEEEEIFTWLNGNIFSWTNWLPGNPNNDQNEDCASLRVGDGKWNDLQCHVATVASPVCSKPSSDRKWRDWYLTTTTTTAGEIGLVDEVDVEYGFSHGLNRNETFGGLFTEYFSPKNTDILDHMVQRYKPEGHVEFINIDLLESDAPMTWDVVGLSFEVDGFSDELVVPFDDTVTLCSHTCENKAIFYPKKEKQSVCHGSYEHVPGWG